MRKSRTAAVLIGAALVSAGLWTSAEAAIEPQVGIAGIELEMTATEVIAAKGEPDRDRSLVNELVGPARIMKYGKTKVFFLGSDDSATVATLQTKNRAQRTAGGAGLGSTEERVKEALPRVRCKDDGRLFCRLGRLRPGKTVTSFRFSNRTDRVSQVFVGFVLD